VELVAPTTFRAKLQEPPVPGDPTSSQQAEQLPTYNAYSIDGDVTAPLVYVNYGVPGGTMSGWSGWVCRQRARSLIARYFGSWRGIKPKVAAEHGAVGCIIYSDPRRTVYTRGDVYPQGPLASPGRSAARQRSWTLPLYPGGPAHARRGATKDAKRLAVSEAPPSPRSRYCPSRTATRSRCSRRCAGHWRRRSGARARHHLHVGPGPAKVHLRVKSDWSLKTLYRRESRGIPGADRGPTSV